jgi:hypoxanthine phosphoribosyltransferase
MSSNLITSFKTFYNNYINEATSVTFNPFSNKIEVNGQQSTQNISLIEPLFTLRALSGNKTSDLTANLLHRTASIFYGYNVVTPEGQQDKSLRNRIYATFKGINDPSYGEYGDKDWIDISRRIPLTIEQYNDIVNTAVEKFIKKTDSKSYSAILYMQSRSTHVFDIAKRIFDALPESRKTPNCEVVEFKKIQATFNIDTLQSIEKIFKIELFAINCINLIPGSPVNFTGDPETDPDDWLIVFEEIKKYVKSILNNIFIKRKKGEGLSIASHIRSIHNKALAGKVLNHIKKKYPVLNINANELPLYGHFDDYQRSSHHDFKSVSPALDVARNDTSNPEILIVDDNINTGDTFKQIDFILKDVEAKFGNTRIFNWNYFILMKDAEYANSNMPDDAIISRANKRVQANNLAAIRQQQLAAKEQPGYIAPSEVKNTINKVINTLNTNLEKEIQVNPLKQEWQKRQQINKLRLEIDNFVKNTNVNKILQNNNNDVSVTVKRLIRMFKNKA